MRKISEILLVISTLILILSGVFDSLAEKIQIEKEEKILLLIGRQDVLNKYYELGAWGVDDGEQSMESYKQYMETNAKPIIEDFQALNPKINRYNNGFKITIFLAIIGHLIVIFLESRQKKSTS